MDKKIISLCHRISRPVCVFLLFLVGVHHLQAQEKFIFTPQWTAQAQFAGYYVAQEKGFYKEAGLNVEIIHPSLTQPAMKRIQNKESHATTLQLSQALEIVDGGIELVNILQTSMNNALTIVSRRGVNPLTQKGARVGIWASGASQLALCVNKKENLGYEWVPFASNVNLFVAGAIDATVAMSYNEYYQLVQTGLPMDEKCVYRLSEHGYNFQEDGLYVTREYYDKHRDQAKKFAQASRKGWEWAAAHPEETLDIVMKYVQDNHIITNKTLQKLMLEEILRLQVDRDSGKREFRLRPDMVKKLNQLLLECNMLKHEITYEQLIAQ